MKKIVSLLITAVMLLGSVGTSVLVSSADGELTPVEGSTIVLDRDSGYIKKIDGVQTVESLSKEFVGEITVKRGGNVLSSNDAVATDDEVSCGDDTLKALIYGDVDRNGVVNTVDVIQLMKYNAKWSGLGISELAADVSDDGKAGTEDVIMLMKYNAGWNISLGKVRMTVDSEVQKAEYDDAGLTIKFTDGMNRVDQNKSEPVGTNTFEMRLAKNEAEMCQALVF